MPATESRSEEATLDDPREEQKVEERRPLSAEGVHAVIRREGERELGRATAELAWSGLAAGLAMGFSPMGEGLLAAGLPDAPWEPLVANLGYTLGFLVIILGRQQLFTENTLTPIIPLLHRSASLGNLLRLWGTVLAANLVGTLIVAWGLARPVLFRPEVHTAFTHIGEAALEGGFGTILYKGIFAGWLIALLVWLLPIADTARLWVVIIMSYAIGLGGFSHSIAGSVEVLYLVVTGAATWGHYLGGFLVPALIGNIIGGVGLVAVLNHQQATAGD